MSKKVESPVHIEWSHDWVRAANISTGQTAEAETIAGLGSILSGAREALVGISRRHIFLKAVRLPKAAPEDLRRILGVQLGQIFPLPIDQLAFDFIQTTEIDSEGCLTIVAAMRADDLRRVRSELQQAGLTASRILPIALASPAVASRSGATDALVIDPDTAGIGFDVVERGILRFSRLTPTDADVDCEARRTTAAAKVADLTRIVAGKHDDKAAQPAGRLTLTLLHEAPPFAFALTEDRENQIKQAIAARTRFGALLVVAAVLLLVYVISDRMTAQQAVDQAQAKWAKTLVILNSDQSQAAERAEAASGVGSSLEAAFDPGQPLSDVVSIIGDSLPPGAWLNELSVERGKPVDIRGTAQNSVEVDQFVRKLGDSPRFRDVHLVFANSATIGKVPVVQFNVDAFAVGNLPMPAPSQLTGTTNVSSNPQGGE